MDPANLPIRKYQQQIVDSVRANAVTVVIGEHGCWLFVVVLISCVFPWHDRRHRAVGSKPQPPSRGAHRPSSSPIGQGEAGSNTTALCLSPCYNWACKCCPAGETGSGKTTQISQILEEAGLAEGSMIGVTQPRRVVSCGLCVVSRAWQLGTSVPRTNDWGAGATAEGGMSVVRGCCCCRRACPCKVCPPLLASSLCAPFFHNHRPRSPWHGGWPWRRKWSWGRR